MGNAPYESANLVPQLPGHIALGVIFYDDNGALKDNGKVYKYWAPATFVGDLNRDVTVVVRGIDKKVRVVSVAPSVSPGTKLKRIKTASAAPPHLRELYLPLRATNQRYVDYFGALSEAIGLKLANGTSRACTASTATSERNSCRNREIPVYHEWMGCQAKAFEEAVEALRTRTEGQPVVPVAKIDVAEVDMADTSLPFEEMHMQDWSFWTSYSNLPRQPTKPHGTPPSNLELIMSKPSLNITTVTYLNGVDVSTLDNDAVFTILNNLRVRIERLEGLPLDMRPDRITTELEQLQRTAREVVELLNNLDAAEAAAKSSDADAIRAVVKDEVKVQLASYASDVPAMPAMPDEGS